MNLSAEITDTVIGVSPFGRPDARLVSAVSRAGGVGVLDLGTGDRAAREELARLSHSEPHGFGVRVGENCELQPADLDDLAGGRAHTVLLGVDSAWDATELGDYYWVLAEVTNRDQAVRALAAGADGLVARGSESGGRVGDLSTFVLLQQLLADPDAALPVWACGGIGEHTAAAAVLGGAAGVVLDTQLALLAESALPQRTRSALAAMDGTETSIVEGARLLRRRGPDEEAVLPVGEDGYLAARFADRWGTAVRAVHGVRTAIEDAVIRESGTTAEEQLPVLGAGSAMAGALGTALPLAQGPMTRVSDQPGFAAAVASEGGLPFMALALADGAQTSDLLGRTRDELAGRPWGVGILGFTDEDTRAAQLAAVREFRPSHAIIAGGRPAQASELEDAGIRTFLHVPTPGLLRQYLEAGARRFVFEGSECGGHVGPLASFPLWEAQLGVLEEYAEHHPDAAGRLEVFFAGGIHDERSAAMVAAMAGPLVARGAAAGLLMGTAYLFTEEAVALGAVRPCFQEQVAGARTTELLRTAPGHATRCVPSPYTAEFAAEERRLRDSGLPQQQVWAELERLNLGRLRIASKGVARGEGTDRAGGALYVVDDERQRAAGMFMAGQVSVLRSSRTTIADLHHAVGEAAREFLSARARLLRPRLTSHAPPPDTTPAPLDIAVVGLACMFPGADGLDAYWAQILSGDDAVTEVPADRWDPSVYHGSGPDSTPSTMGGFLPRIPFDPLAYGIPPASLGAIEPVQLLALEAARRALDHAGYADRAFDRSRASVVFGAEAGSDLANATTLRTVLPSYVKDVPPALAGQLPRLTEDSFPGMLANVISGRIANRLDLGGANYTVDAACASSLAAVDVACKELVLGTSDMVLCGGADLHNGINDYLLFSSVGALSPTGRCRTFDADADGIALGEGVACVVLKRLADAERDGDEIYAVIKGIGSASDGRGRGLTAPRPEGQKAALDRAYRRAGVSPAEVGLVEAHGTGTVVGDRTELTVLSEVFTEAGAEKASCALGSVKSQIGHTKCAAGLAGLIKTVMALHTGVLPPTRQLTRPNPAWHPDHSPFVFHTRARPWGREPAERYAGVSAFGFGGTNFHVVLGAYGNGAPPAHGHLDWSAELFTFHGRDQEAAEREVQRLLDTLSDPAPDGPRRLRDLAAETARRAAGRSTRARIAVVAPDLASLPELLRRALAGQHDPAVGVFLARPTGAAEGPASEEGAEDTAHGRVAFLFPGQGSQRPGMAADLLIAFPWLQRHLELGASYADVLYPAAGFSPEAAERQRAALTDTRNAQPALGIAGLAGHDLLTHAGVAPDMAGGHSYGELVALSAAGALGSQALLDLSGRRARAILEAAGDDPGGMAAVSADEWQTRSTLEAAGLAGRVVLANLNTPAQTVISGPTQAVQDATRVLREAGHGAKVLPVACAFHSPQVADACALFRADLDEAEVRGQEFTVWSNATAMPYPQSPSEVRDILAAQIGAPVRFAEQIEAMYAAGARVFVEAGPGTVLTGLVGKILADRPHVAVPIDPWPDAGLRGFLECLARLAVAGVPVRTDSLFHGRHSPKGATHTRSLGWSVDGHLVRDAAGEPLPGALRPARRISLEESVTGNASHGAERAEQDALVSEFLRSSRELVAAQRDVLLSYFGAAPSPATIAPLPDVGRHETPSPLPVLPAPVPAPSPAQPAPAPEENAPPTGTDLLHAVLEIISERTGYPADMIEPDLDLEADLSIDSIKRTEIAGELGNRLGGAAGTHLDDQALEELAQARTAEAIASWLTARRAPDTPDDTLAAPGDHTPAPEGEQTDDAPEEAPALVSGAPERFVVRPVSLDPPSAEVDLTGRRFAVLGWAGDVSEAADEDECGGPGAGHNGRARNSVGEVAQALVDELARRGATAVVLDRSHILTQAQEPLDGVFYLPALDENAGPVLPDDIAVLKSALDRNPAALICASHLTGDAGTGLPGLLRAIAREYPDTTARLVRASGDMAPAERFARALLDELAATDGEPVVDHTPEGRAAPRPEPTPLGSLAHSGAGPAGDGAAEATACGLDADSVVVLAGGARGITARFALALAAAARCKVELLGRTPMPETLEDLATAAASDRAALRSVLAAAGGRTPAEVDRTAGLILAQREVRATLEELAELGSPARYHAIDLRDSDAVDRTLKEVLAEHGRIDAVVAGAGVIEDRLLADKDVDSFRRVYGTKVEGARHLLDAAASLTEHPLLAVLFGSIAAVHGNRGQSDYAAANSALESLGADWAARTGHRALTVHWGPWAPTGAHAGMVTPELGRDYARRGIRLIDPDEGVLALLRELAWGDPALTSVVLTASGW